MTDQTEPKVSSMPGLAIMACMITGVIGVVFCFAHDDATGLIAASIAFGLVGHAALS